MDSLYKITKEYRRINPGELYAKSLRSTCIYQFVGIRYSSDETSLFPFLSDSVLVRYRNGDISINTSFGVNGSSFPFGFVVKSR